MEAMIAEWSSKCEFRRMRPVEWCLSSYDTRTRSSYQREGALLDAHRWSCRILHHFLKRHHSASHQHETDHPPSTHPRRWARNPSRVHSGSLSYTRPCRATTSGHRGSAAPLVQVWHLLVKSWAQVGRKGIGLTSARLAPAIDLT